MKKNMRHFQKKFLSVSAGEIAAAAASFLSLALSACAPSLADLRAQMPEAPATSGGEALLSSSDAEGQLEASVRLCHPLVSRDRALLGLALAKKAAENAAGRQNTGNEAAGSRNSWSSRDSAPAHSTLANAAFLQAARCAVILTDAETDPAALAAFAEEGIGAASTAGSGDVLAGKCRPGQSEIPADGPASRILPNSADPHSAPDFDSDAHADSDFRPDPSARSAAAKAVPEQEKSGEENSGAEVSDSAASKAANTAVGEAGKNSSDQLPGVSGASGSNPGGSGSLSRAAIPGACSREALQASYYHAVLTGQQMRIAGMREALKLLDEEIRLLEAAQNIPDEDQGGPLRVCGMLLLRPPAWPAGPGDIDRALELLKSAAERYPSHPLNHLFYAAALNEDGSAEAAKEQLAAGIRLADEAVWGDAAARWKDVDALTKIGD